MNQSVNWVHTMWPMVLDNTREECKRSLRRYELEAYSAVVTALRAQGDLNNDKRKLLQDLSSLLSISLERHRAEVRRAVNDERLNTIAHHMNHMNGANTLTEWTIEGRRLIPLLPRLVPQTAFTGLANTVANAQAVRNQTMLSPSETGVKQIDVNQGTDESLGTNTPKRRRVDSQSQSQTTFVPMKSNSISEPIVLQNTSTLPSNHRNTHPMSKASTSRTVVNANTCYTVTTSMGPQSVGQSGARVIFMSTPTTSPSNMITTSAKNVTAFPLNSRYTLGSPQKPVIDVPNTRPTKQRPGRPVNTSIVGLIGVSGTQTNQKLTKSQTNKTAINASNVSIGANVTRIPFIPGTQVFAKNNGQQQVVVFPVNSRQPVSVPISQTVKAISIPTSPTVTTNAPTLIYQSTGNMKNVQKVQTPNLIIMQQKQIIQTSKPLTTVPATAITLSKANIAKTQVKSQMFAHKKQVVDIGPNPSNQSQIINLSENSKIIAKRLQTSPKSLQEMNASLPELAQRGVIEIDASNEAFSGLFNSVRSGSINATELMEMIKKGSITTVQQPNVDPRGADIHDSSSEDTVSTSESPLHEMQSDFGDISDMVCSENVKTLLDK